MTHVTRERSRAEIEGTVIELARRYAVIADSIACVLHCKQVHSKTFYDQLRTEAGVEIITQRDATWTKKLAKMLFGFPAVIVIGNAGQIQPLFDTIVEQAYGGLYFFDRNFLSELLACLQERPSELEASLENDPLHLKYFIDEDSAVQSDSVVELISFGAQCNVGLIAALKLNA